MSHLVMVGFVLLLVVGGIALLRAMALDITALSEHTVEITRELERLRAAGLRIVASSAELALLRQNQAVRAFTAEAIDPDQAETETEWAAREEIELTREGIAAYTSAFAGYSDLVDRHFPEAAANRDALGRVGQALMDLARRMVEVAAAGAGREELFRAKGALENLEQSYLSAVKRSLDRQQELYELRRRTVRDDLTDAKQLAWIGFLVAAGAILFLGVLITQSITRPLGALTEAARDLAAGNLERRVGTEGEDELGMLGRAFNRMAQAIRDNIDRRLRAEDRLHRAEKMEAIGQLTGGVAHDFNNLLTVIQGGAEMLADKVGGDDPYIQAIKRSAQRGAELNQSLLAFSGRQPLHPDTIKLSDHVAQMEARIRGIMGPDVEIRTSSSPELWYVLTDPDQLESAILNLCQNAREAMPDGGTLSFDCRNVRVDADSPERAHDIEPGDYVVLDLRDTGKGMPKEVRDRAFEPFFTTKEFGSGSGMGLAMVYGIARQSGGGVILESEPGKGTRVRLYLPRNRSPGAVPPPEERPLSEPSHGQRILIVDDNASILDITETTVRGLGYLAFAVDTAERALAALAREHYDLVLTDVILGGGVTGTKFAAEVRARHPGVKVIFMSGYPANVVQREAALGPGEALIAKPFSRETLAAALAAALS